ncbi:MAG: transcriptional activator NhaR [Pseudomonadota bacterium]
MRHLNYNHLQYFWTVAREGSMAAAAKSLHITPQTISGQLRLLEDAIGQPLFNRVGRRLVLTDLGHTVFEYADEIFSIGGELANVVRGQGSSSQSTFKVGMVSSMPKLIAERILGTVLMDEDGARIRCHESSFATLLGELATHRLDIVLSDQPMQPGLSLRAYNHKLGESGMTFFCRSEEAARYRSGFPGSLSHAPMLLPTSPTATRRRLDDWFAVQGVAPQIVGEFDDSALLKAFGEAGFGIFVAPTAIENEVCRMYHAEPVGRTKEVLEQFYVISPERRIKHPAITRIIEGARSSLFNGEESELRRVG